MSKDRRRMAKWLKQSGLCWLCQQPIDVFLNTADLYGPSLDHIIPVSKGGRGIADNLRLAHRWCNAKRGNAPAIGWDDSELAMLR